MNYEGSGRLLHFPKFPSFHRVSAYLFAQTAYASSEEEACKQLRLVYDLNVKFKRFPEAQRCALKLKDEDLLKRLFDECEDDLVGPGRGV